MRKIAIVLIAAALFSCRNYERFTVEGTVENAAGETLVLEHTGILQTEALDSVKITPAGKYRFKAAQPGYPDFYRLRIKNKIIAFAVDSTETISIHADYNRLPAEYSIEGSPVSEQIKELRLSVMNIQNKIAAIKDDMPQDERLGAVQDIEIDINEHKTKARRLIMENPRSAAAYFALYQQINNDYIFSPYLKEDYPYWAAAATAYHAFMPDYERSKNIYNFVLGAVKEKQKAKQAAALNELIKEAAKGYIDIDLPDAYGRERSLAELEGKVVLIDFTAYEMEGSIEYTFSLRSLYDKYNKLGFEIYQVSLDRSKLMWEISTENIPWVCVRGENGPASRFAQLYNVSKIPTTFLMNREGNIVARDMKFDELDREIGKLVKKK